MCKRDVAGCVGDEPQGRERTVGPWKASWLNDDRHLNPFSSLWRGQQVRQCWSVSRFSREAQKLYLYSPSFHFQCCFSVVRLQYADQTGHIWCGVWSLGHCLATSCPSTSQSQLDPQTRTGISSPLGATFYPFWTGTAESASKGSMGKGPSFLGHSGW